MSTIPAALLPYLSEKLRLFPVSPKTKKPLIADYFQKSSASKAQIMKWLKTFPGCNWGMPMAINGLVALDLDVRNDGIRKWDQLAGSRVFSTRTQTTSTGGKHFVFKAPEGVKFTNKIDEGVDIKHNGFLIVAPSIYKGQAYKWDNWEAPFAPLPAWVHGLLERQEERAKTEGPVAAEMEYGTLREMIDLLKTVHLTYDHWVHAGMAIQAVLPGKEGLDLFLDLTRNKAYAEGDEELAEKKWDSFKGDGVTPATLYYILKSYGLRPRSPDFEQDLKLFDTYLDQDLLNEEALRKHDGFYERNGSMICWETPSIIKHFNEHFAYLHSAPSTPFMHLKTTSEGLEWSFLNGQMLEHRMAPYRKAALAVSKTGRMEVKLTPAHKLWVNHINRREFSKLTFEEHDTPGDLNLWGGLTIKPLWEGDGGEIIDMITRSLCNSDQRKADWFLDWLAFLVQEPFQRVSTVPVLISEQGAGKGLLFDYVMRQILGRYFTAVQSSAELVAKFNMNLSHKLLTFIDEATWRGNKTEDGILKRMIGSPTISVEEKFGDRYEVKNFSRYVIASNNPDAVAMEKGNRRYVVLEADPKMANKREYFGPLAEKIKEGTITRSFYAQLLRRDVSEFDPHKIISDNYGGAVAKLKTAGPEAEFWYSTFTEDPHRLWTTKTVFAPEPALDSKEAYNQFLDFTRRVGTYDRGLTPHMFWNKTTRLVPACAKKRDTAKGYVRRVTPEAFWKEFTHSLMVQADHVEWDSLIMKDIEDEK